MPEGDTIFRAARTLSRALAGSVVTRFETVLPALARVHADSPLTGRTVERVWSAGKHLLMQFSGELVLRTHMRMNGSWHVYRTGERWRRPRRDMRIVIATTRFEAIAFNVPVAEFLRCGELNRHPQLGTLGPDLLAATFDAAEALRRIQSHSEAIIDDVLLNQRAVSGIGNVYKSEVLFLCGINPFVRVGMLDTATLETVLGTARRLLVTNVKEALPLMTTYGGYRRTTQSHDPSQRLWVYGRGGKPCRRCGTPISARKHGLHARLTYWCPRCQA